MVDASKRQRRRERAGTRARIDDDADVPSMPARVGTRDMAMLFVPVTSATALRKSRAGRLRA